MRLRICRAPLSSLLLVALLAVLPRAFSTAENGKPTSRAAAASARRVMFNYTIVHNEESYESPPRVVIDPFRLTLSKFDGLLSERNQEELLATMERVSTNYLRERPTTTAVPSPKLQYVKFGAMNQQVQDESLTIEVDVGVASYEEHPTPNEGQVHQWVQEALKYDLVPNLQLLPNFSTVETVDFALQQQQQYGPPEFYPPATPSENKAIETNTTQESPNKRRRRRRIAMWCVFGLALTMALFGLLFLAVSRFRRREQVVSILDEVKPETPSTYNDVENNNNLDTRSVADSESEWTVATEAGDSMAIKSIHPSSGLVVTSPVTSALVMSESFERDRQVAISKDMLTGKWSGNLTNPPGKASGTSESVLQPSHFTAATEQRDREARAVRHVPDLEASSLGSSSSNNSSQSDSATKERRWPHPPDDDDQA